MQNERVTDSYHIVGATIGRPNAAGTAMKRPVHMDDNSSREPVAKKTTNLSSLGYRTANGRPYGMRKGNSIFTIHFGTNPSLTEGAGEWYNILL